MADENPFTRKRREAEPERDHEYDLSSVALALVNIVKAIPEAKEIRELRAGVKRALHTAAERL